MRPSDNRMAGLRAVTRWALLPEGDLAEASGVSLRTIVHFEVGERQPIPANLAAIKRALEAAGIEFIAENGGGPGVRLARAKRKARSKTDDRS